MAGGGWREELDGLARAVSGGMLFGVPLLYTMEVWWIGSATDPDRLVAVLGITALLVFVLLHTGGFRSTADSDWRDAGRDTVEVLAVALVSTAVVLLLLRELGPGTPAREALGKVVYESTPFSIGAALARSFLSRGRTEGDDGRDGAEPGRMGATVADVGATLLGALFVAFNIAPTDEIPMIAAAMSPAWTLMLMATTLAVTYLIVFEAGFSDQERRRAQAGLFQHPVTETVGAYLLALAGSAAMLWFFQRTASGVPLRVSATHAVVLALPAAVGGAAGRLAV